MNFRSAEISDFEYMAENSINKRVDRNPRENSHFIYTLENNGVPIMLGGFMFITPATAWCWIDISSEFDKNKIIAYRTIKEWMGLFAKDHNIARLQAFVRCDFPEANRLMHHLGFEIESTMEKFFGTEDAYMYRKIT